jgi:outer membrane protein OmpA-like peptidoglycan-associated protein
MFCRKSLGGQIAGKALGVTLAGVVLAAVAGLQLTPARAEERMQLGVPLGPSTEFQSQVGDRVFFSDASAELGSRGRVALEAQAVWLARNPQLSVVVEGHADDAGDIARNMEVSQRRADAVRRRLIQMGVAPERVRIVAYGRERPIADCAEAACAAQNRRAVTVIGPPVDTAATSPAPIPASGPISGRAPRDDWAPWSTRRVN